MVKQFHTIKKCKISVKFTKTQRITIPRSEGAKTNQLIPRERSTSNWDTVKKWPPQRPSIVTLLIIICFGFYSKKEMKKTTKSQILREDRSPLKRGPKVGNWNCFVDSHTAAEDVLFSLTWWVICWRKSQRGRKDPSVGLLFHTISNSEKKS